MSRVMWAALWLAAACAAAACPAPCSCRGEHVACDSVPLHRFPPTEPHVRHVSVSGARLPVLSAAGLQERALRTLVLVASHVHRIEPHALASMGMSLASLDLGHNEFTEVPTEALRDLSALNWLNLQNNRIGELSPTAEWGAAADSLSSLSLADNQLRELRAGALAALRRLARLDLDGNRLHAVAAGALPPSLSALRLADNSLPTPPCAALAALPRLRRLHLAGNALRPAPDPTCRSAYLDLEELDLGRNELDDLFALDLGRPRLRRLVLDSNEYTAVPPLAVEGGRLERLSMSHNRLERVSNAAVRALRRDLERLDLDRNELTSLPPNARELTRLRHLSVAYNRLKEARPLPPRLESLSLAGNYLEALPVALRELRAGSLRRLDLGYNRVSAVNAHDFGAWSSALAALDLRGNLISALGGDAFPATLPLRELLLGFNELRRVEVTALANLTRLQTLDLSTALPTGEFPPASDSGTISWLSLDNNNILRVSMEHLERFPSLEYLNLDFNEIVEFPSDLDVERRFESGLRELRLSSNRITGLSSEFLKSSLELRSVDLSYNRVRDVAEGTFANLQNLLYVNLAGNQLESIDAGALAHLPRLTALDLQHNSLVELSTRHFENVSNDDREFTVNVSFNHINSLIGGDTESRINVLDLSHNSIDAPSRAFFKSLGSHIRRLILSHNRIGSVDDDGFGSPPNLQILDLSNNRLGLVRRRVFAEMPSLQVLDLSHNGIRQLSVEQFLGLRNLRHLRLDGNELRSLPRDCFESTALEHLDLADNRLTIFPSSALAHVGLTLRRLELARNRLEHLDAAMFRATAFLRELSLANNALSALADNAFAALPHLLRLDLSGNAIKTNFEELFRGAPSLRGLTLSDAGLRVAPRLPLANLTDLDLSGNSIAALRERDALRLGELRALDISRNRLTSLRSPAWAALPRLVSLDASANPIARISRGSFDGLDGLLRLRLERLRRLEAVEPPAFQALADLRSLAVESPMTGAAEPALAEVVASMRALEGLTVTVRRGALEEQLLGVAAPRLRALEVRGVALRRVSARAFASLGRQRALTVRLRGTGVTTLPPGLLAPLARVPHLALELADNRLMTLSPEVLYPNLTGWNGLATRLLPGGLALSERSLGCGCAVRWVGAWLRRWAAEAGAWSARARGVARAARCVAAGGQAVPLVSLAARQEAGECGAAARAAARGSAARLGLAARTRRLLPTAYLLILRTLESV